MKSYNIIPYFVGMEGCKSRCIYCNQHVLKGYTKNLSLKDFVQQHRKLFRHQHNMELAFYGGTFFNLNPKRRDFFKNEIISLKESKLIDRARCSTTPESISKEVMDEFKGVIDCVELGVQSMDDYVLKISNRRYLAKDVIYAFSLLKYYGYESAAQLMIGMPFESRTSHIYTTQKILDIKPDFVRLYPLFILKGTMLHSYYNLGYFKPISNDELIWRLAYSFINFNLKGINVIKIGLTEFVDKQDTVFIHYESDLRGKVLSFIFLNLLLKHLSKDRHSHLSCNKADYQYIVGVKKTNLKKLNNMGYFFDISITDIERNHIEIDGRDISISDLNLVF